MSPFQVTTTIVADTAEQAERIAAAMEEAAGKLDGELQDSHIEPVNVVEL